MRRVLCVLFAFLMVASFASAQKVPLVIGVYDQDAPVKAALDPLWAQYEKANPNIDVQPWTLAYREDKLAVMIAAGTAPDMWQINALDIPKWVDQGAIMDLTPLIDRDKIDLSDLWPGYKDALTVKGKIYALGQGINTEPYIYNGDLFAEAGLAKPPGIGKNPLSLDDMVAQGQKISQYDASGKLTQAMLEQTWPGWDLLSSFYAPMWDNSKQKFNMTEPNVVKLWQMAQDVAYKTHIAFTPAEQQAIGGDLFGKGLVAYKGFVSWSTPNFIQSVIAGNYKFDVNFTLMPGFDPKTAKSGAWMDVDVMPAKPKNATEAWKFFKWLHTDKNAYQTFAMGLGRIPVYQSMKNDWYVYWLKKGMPASLNLDLMFFQLNRTAPIYDYPYWLDYGTVVWTIQAPYANKVWDNKITPRDALAQMQADLDKHVEAKKKELGK